MPNLPYKVTRKLQRKITLLVAMGMSERDIAVATKVSRQTLREHYSDQLQNGRALFRAELGEMLRKAADQGNVTAMKHLDARTSGEVPVGTAATGKKAEQAKAAAQAGAGTEWGDDLKPVVLTGRAN